MKKFRDLEYVRPNIEEVINELDEKIEAFKNANSYEEMKEAYFAFSDSMSHFSTISTIASIRADMNTADEFYKQEEEFYNESFFKVVLKDTELSELLVASKFKDDFAKEYGNQIIKDIEASIKLNSLEIEEESIKIAKLVSSYSRKVAECKTEFRGEECNFYGLLKHMLDDDRNIRKEAMHAWSDLYASVADELDDIYKELCELRRSQADKLGFDNYIDMAYLNMNRYDYGPKEVEKFRDAVKKYIVPLANKLHEAQKERLGIDKLRYYDENLYFKEGNPEPNKTMQEMVAAAQKTYSELSKETKEFFDFMVEYELYDLETRPNKHMGGYCTSLPDYKAPFIYSNFNGTSADMQVLTHEAGHAFEGFMASRNQPLMSYYWSTSDINEIHSMAMEFFTDKWYGLFYEGSDGDRYRYEHLVESICNIPYLVSVDEFQHRVFEGGEKTSEDLRKIWKDIEEKYMPWRDYDGDEFLEGGAFWMQKQHIFMYPFYYVDYALAMLCALQFFVRMQSDFDGAWKDYLHLCKLGGSKGYNELLKEANLGSPFEEKTIENVIETVTAVLKELEEKL